MNYYDVVSNLIEHVEGEDGESQIVAHHDAPAGVRLPVAHEFGPHPHDQQVHDSQCKGWSIAVQ